MSRLALTAVFQHMLDFNLSRYADEPEALARFQGLTFGDVTYGVVTVDSDTRVRSTSWSSTSRVFGSAGADQTWSPSDIADGTEGRPLWIRAQYEVLASVTDLTTQTVPGVYEYQDDAGTKFGIVYPYGTAAEDVEAAIADLVSTKAYYDFDTLTVGTDEVYLENVSMEGTLVIAEADQAMLVIPPTDYGRIEVPNQA